MPVSQSSPAALHPTIFVIFGVTGDLAGRKLIPALIGLYAKKLLPLRFAVIGFSRRSFNRKEFREFIRGHINVRPADSRKRTSSISSTTCHTSRASSTMPRHRAASERLKGIDAEWGQCSNKLFHLSVPPHLYEGILNQLSVSGLTVPCADDTGWTRILIEKPFGSDQKHARRLDKLLGKLFKEEQIFRIDHCIAKETLQTSWHSVSPTRYSSRSGGANSYKIHIKLYETYGMEGRGAFYDSLGALKGDWPESHALYARDRDHGPAGVFLGPAVAHERARVLRKLARIKPRRIAEQVVKGQYVGYTGEAGVKNDSSTETYFRIRCFIDSARWRGVPIWLENGKALNEAKTEIDVYFKGNSKVKSLPSTAIEGQKSKVDAGTEEGTQSNGQNILTLRIQPDEGIRLKFFVKLLAPSSSSNLSR